METEVFETELGNIPRESVCSRRNSTRRKHKTCRYCIIFISTMIPSLIIGTLIGFFAIPAIIQTSARSISRTTTVLQPEETTTISPQTSPDESTLPKQKFLEGEELLMDVIDEENSVTTYYSPDFDIPSSLHNHTQGFSLVRVRTDNASERICIYLPLVQGADFTRSLAYAGDSLNRSAPLLINQPSILLINPIRDWETLGGPATMSMYVSEMCDLESIYRVCPNNTYLKESFYPYSATLDMEALFSDLGHETDEHVDLKVLLSDLPNGTPSVNVDIKMRVTGFHVMEGNVESAPINDRR